MAAVAEVVVGHLHPHPYYFLLLPSLPTLLPHHRHLRKEEAGPVHQRFKLALQWATRMSSSS